MKNYLRHLLAMFCGLTVLASFASAHGDEFTPEYVDSLVPDYLALQKALALDDFSGAQKAARTLHATAMKGPEFKDFTGFVHEIITAPDLKVARANFAEVSSELITVIDHVGTSGKQALFSAHCPMAFGGKGGDWVQDNQTVLNPYYGSMMLRCGAISEQIAGKPKPNLPPGGQHAHGNLHSDTP